MWPNDFILFKTLPPLNASLALQPMPIHFIVSTTSPPITGCAASQVTNAFEGDTLPKAGVGQAAFLGIADRF
jgi:hypothetical protein